MKNILLSIISRLNRASRWGSDAFEEQIWKCQDELKEAELSDEVISAALTKTEEKLTGMGVFVISQLQGRPLVDDWLLRNRDSFNAEMLTDLFCYVQSEAICRSLALENYVWHPDGQVRITAVNAAFHVQYEPGIQATFAMANSEVGKGRYANYYRRLARVFAECARPEGRPFLQYLYDELPFADPDFRSDFESPEGIKKWRKPASEVRYMMEQFIAEDKILAAWGLYKITKESKYKDYIVAMLDNKPMMNEAGNISVPSVDWRAKQALADIEAQCAQ